MTISNVEFKRALVANLGTQLLVLDDTKDVIYSEKILSSSSKNPYFKSFTGMFGFLKNYGEAIDFIAVNGLNVSGIKSLKQVIETYKVEQIAFSKNVATLNYSFFDNKYKAPLSIHKFLALLKYILKVDVYSAEDNGVLYVYIKKS